MVTKNARTSATVNSETFTYSYLANSDLIQTLTSPLHVSTRGYEDYRDVLSSVTNTLLSGKTLRTSSSQTYSSSPTISKYEYAVNALGQRTDLIRSGRAFTEFDTSVSATGYYDHVDYDNRGEVTGTTRHAGNTLGSGTALTALDTTYTFDGIGNRTTTQGPTWLGSSSQGTRNYSTDAVNGYNSYEIETIGTWTPGHDADGNLTDEIWTINTWDAENRLVKREPSDPTVNDFRWTYEYDYRGRRVKQTAEIYYTSTPHWNLFLIETFVYDGWNIATSYSKIPDYSTTLWQKRKFTWGLDVSGSIHGAGGVGGLLKLDGWHLPGSTTEKRYVYLYDGNGNVTELLGEYSGDVIFGAHYEYDAFGMITNSPMPYAYAANNIAWSNPFRFSTKYLAPWNWRDLHYAVAYHLIPAYGYYCFRYYDYGYRWYSPWFGRWTSRDPLSEQGGINLLSFLANDALKGVDLLGGANTSYYDIIKEFLKLLGDEFGKKYNELRELKNARCPDRKRIEELERELEEIREKIKKAVESLDKPPPEWEPETYDDKTIAPGPHGDALPPFIGVPYPDFNQPGTLPDPFPIGSGPSLIPPSIPAPLSGIRIIPPSSGGGLFSPDNRRAWAEIGAWGIIWRVSIGILDGPEPGPVDLLLWGSLAY